MRDTKHELQLDSIIISRSAIFSWPGYKRAKLVAEQVTSGTKLAADPFQAGQSWLGLLRSGTSYASGPFRSGKQAAGLLRSGLSFVFFKLQIRLTGFEVGCPVLKSVVRLQNRQPALKPLSHQTGHNM